jgi:hypothetical protein
LKQQILVDGCSGEVTVLFLRGNKMESIITRVDNVQCNCQQNRVRRGGNTNRLLVLVVCSVLFGWFHLQFCTCLVQEFATVKGILPFRGFDRALIDSGFHHCLFGS